MKNLIKFMLPAFALSMAFTSCDKVETTPSPKVDTPQTTTPTAPTPATPNVTSTAHGVMVALQMNFTYNMPQMPMPVSYKSDYAIATFYSAVGSSTLVDAGTVKANTNELKKQSNNSYMITPQAGQATTSLGFDGASVDWSVTGAGIVPQLTYSHSGGFPKYSGTLPTEITKSAGLEINLGGNVTNADSVLVIIIDKAGKMVQKTYGAKPAPSKASFTAADLTGLSVVTDNAAYLEVVPYKYVVRTTGGKDYVYIKQYAEVTTVNIK